MVEPHPPSVDPPLDERVELIDEDLYLVHRSPLLTIALNCAVLGKAE